MVDVAGIGLVSPSGLGTEETSRLRANALLSEVPTPLSSVETHKLIADGLEVSAPISLITFLMAEGLKPCAPKEPRPPQFETVAVNRCVPCEIGLAALGDDVAERDGIDSCGIDAMAIQETAHGMRREREGPRR